MKKLVFCFVFLLCSFYIFAQNIGDKVYKEVTVDGKRVNKWLELCSEKKYNENGLLITDGRNYYEYDDKNNIVYYYEGYSLDYIKEWHKYDSNGREIYFKCYKEALMFGVYEDREEWYEYDENNNRIYEKHRSYEYYKEYWNEYDSNCKITKRKCSDNTSEIFIYDLKGNLIHKKDFDGTDFYYEYDEENNMIISYYNGKSETYKYKSGKVVYHKEVDGTRYWYEYDEKNNLIYEKYNYNTTDSGYEYWYDYDENGNRIHTKSGNGSEWWSVYDAKGNIIYEYSRNGYQTFYEYEFYPNGKVKVCREWRTF